MLARDAVLSRVGYVSSAEALWEYLRLQTSIPVDHRQLTRLGELIGREVKLEDLTTADAAHLIDFLVYVRDRSLGDRADGDDERNRLS